MLSPSQQEKLTDEAIRASFEAATLRDLGASVLPLLERTLDTSASLLYRFDAEARLENIAGTQVAANFEYMEEYSGQDPMQRVMHLKNPWIFHASRYPEWQQMVRLPVYEFCLREGIDDYIFLRLSETAHDAPGMVGILLARSKRQPDFSEAEELLLARALPSLTSLVRRSLRAEKILGITPYVETMLELGGAPKLALSLDGKLLWASEEASAAMVLAPGRSRSIPDPILKSVRQFRRFWAKAGAPTPTSSVLLDRQGRAPIRADLRLARTHEGSSFVIVELEIPGLSPRMREAAARFRLSPAETEVLGLLAQGHADREIGKKLFVSLPTVRSHVGQILSKIGVRSRVQAALIANGLNPEAAREDNPES